MSDTPHSASSALSEPQHVTQPVQIAGILRRLQDAHALVHVSRPGDSESWLSAILEVHPTQGYLLLDELTPRDGNALMRDTRRLIVSAQIQGVDVSFASDLLEIGFSDGMAFYRVSIPGNVRYWQRRNSHRARVGAATVVPVTLEHNEAGILKGELYDISAGGICTRHRGKQDIVPMLGDIWPKCTIALPGGDQIPFALEIRYVGNESRGNLLRLGGRFVDITRPHLKAIEGFVAHLEREHLRKVRRTRGG